jgi:hypothetical protein
MAHLHGFFRIGLVHIKRGTFIQDHDQVSTQLALNLDRCLRGQCMHPTIDIGLKSRPLLRDPLQRPVLGAITLAFDLFRYGTMTQAEDLIAARVREHRAIPAHKLVQPPHLLNQGSAGLQHQVIGVRQNDLRARILHLGWGCTLNGSLGGAKNKRRRLNRAMGRFQLAEAGATGEGLFDNSKRKLIRHALQ